MNEGRIAHETPDHEVAEVLRNIHNRSDEKGWFTVRLDSRALFDAAIRAMLGLRVPGAWLFCREISPRDEFGRQTATFHRI